MKYYCAVEVEHVRYARFLPLDQPRRRTMELTTLADNQRRAEIKLYLMQDEERIHLHTFSVSPLPKERAGEPRIHLHGNFDGLYSLRVDIDVDGKRYDSKELSLRRYMRRSPLIPILLTLLALALLAGGLLLMRSCMAAGSYRDAAPRERERVLEEPAETEPAETQPAETEPAREREEGAESEVEAYGTADGETGDDAGTRAGADEEPADATETGTQAETGTAEAADGDTLADTGDSAERDDTATTADGSGETAAIPPRSETLYFEPDSATLTSAGQEKLRELLPLLKQVTASRVEIAGHCALYGTEQGRLELSAERARAAYRYLQDRGWDPAGEPQLSWYGGKRPVTTDRERQGLNRRVEIRILEE